MKNGLEDYYVIRGNKKMRFGYTTGSCAAAACKGAAEILLGGVMQKAVTLMTPKGILLTLELKDIRIEGNQVTCAIQKDAGDDPDTTNGILVYATVQKTKEPGIILDGGVGVGRVTKAGLSQKIGEAAINPVPKAMILREATEIAEKYDYEGGLKITISVPEGVEIAKKTFNPRLGIVGGISILGTSGIVEPMSEAALVQSINVEMKQHFSQGEEYLLVLKVQTEDQDLVRFYSILTYLGTNHVQDCVDFAQRFHEMTLTGDSDGVLNYLEQDGSMDGKNLGYINIHSRSGPVTWGDMQVEQIGDPSLRFTELESDITALTMEYQVTNTETSEQYQVREAYRLRYTSTRIYLLAYERWTDKILEPGRQLVEDGKLSFGIQSSEPVYMKNTEENVVGFVEQGQLWSYDYGQNRLSLVYGFTDGQDGRADWKEHDFRLLKVDDTGSMDFLLYGYMNRGRYEGRSGVMFCHYDALMNTVEELFFVPSDQSYAAMKEDIGDLAVQNGNGKAWLCWQGNLLQINLDDHSVTILARNVNASDLQVSDSGLLTAWNDEDSGDICLLNTSTGVVSRIEAGDGEVLKTLGFMEEDLIYGAGYSSDIYTDQAGRSTV